jgi:hypothetical protein
MPGAVASIRCTRVSQKIAPLHMAIDKFGNQPVGELRSR